MTIKQALFMNFISSLTSFIGAILGVSLGTQWHAVPWLFAITSGLFIYIALVDMVSMLVPNILRSIYAVHLAVFVHKMLAANCDVRINENLFTAKD